ncbi:16S rRNA (uracil(1498)-N(3))-methyltransferase [Luteimonas chenhongjianii]|uniref:Ribosomal RNA small subunit methyltransferase E n=1 Tax=Luteimonas chenhongjianii TaxID=2006110 RepID=A0A290XDI2_9GAMM|nr:16S rRNA (uracil(1498)-N(3))-methyltransferase [Luteimonas chenhongjianii]ATD66996.1 16S rRNA (uracil(1498)-N(3))-methyltransferase [Luteimonas chenhongjianii]
MRVIRAFVDRPLGPGASIELPDDAAAHLVRVLRLREGDACVLFNGDGFDHDARLVKVGKRGASAEIVGTRAVDVESPLRITLVQGIARGEKMDWILQKATELGVAAFLPVSSDRSEVRLDAERAAKRHAHWRSVVTSACEQSWRARVPEVSAPQPLAAALAGLAGSSARWLLDPEAETGIAALPAPSGDVVLAIGPEGGWSANDRAALVAAGFGGLRLGPRILRTETAGMAAIAALQARFGDLAG